VAAPSGSPYSLRLLAALPSPGEPAQPGEARAEEKQGGGFGNDGVGDRIRQDCPMGSIGIK
jgi:hypothetical protein